MKTNYSNFVIPEANLKKATEALELFMSSLQPYLIEDITANELEGYSRLGQAGNSFVTAMLEFAVAQPEIVPGYCKVEDAKIDYAYFNQLNNILLRLEGFSRLMQINRDLAGIEMLDFSNEIYHILKRLNVKGDPNAMAAYEKVKKHYKRTRKKAEAPTDASHPPAS